MFHDLYQSLQDPWSGPVSGQTVAVGFASLFFAAIAINIWRDNLRKKTLARLANQLGLNYAPLADDALAMRNDFLRSYHAAPDSKVSNVLEGVYQSHAVCAFDYRYVAGGTGRHYQYSNYVALTLPASSPNLRIYPRDFASQLTRSVTRPEVEFDSLEFSDAFAVKYDDSRFAHTFCHPQMIEYLLQHKDISIAIRGSYLTMSFPGDLNPRKLPTHLQQLVELRNLFPTERQEGRDGSPSRPFDTH